jgi:hypothetical protein
MNPSEEDATTIRCLAIKVLFKCKFNHIEQPTAEGGKV